MTLRWRWSTDNPGTEFKFIKFRAEYGTEFKFIKFRNEYGTEFKFIKFSVNNVPGYCLP